MSSTDIVDFRMRDPKVCFPFRITLIFLEHLKYVILFVTSNLRVKVFFIDPHPVRHFVRKLLQGDRPLSRGHRGDHSLVLATADTFWLCVILLNSSIPYEM